MILKTIELEGYSSYKNYVLISLDSGITGIFGAVSGKPDQSNGSGKTSMLMAIIYALYGEGEFDKVEELKNDKSDSMRVRLTWEMNNTLYTVERGLEKTKSFLILTQNGVRLGDSIASSQAEIIKLIGMDYSMFTASVFFEQGNMDKFINAPADTRRKYIDKVIGNDLWTDLSKSESKSMRELQASIVVYEDECSQLENNIAANNLIISEQENSVKKLVIIKKLIEDLTGELQKYSNIELAKANFDELTPKRMAVISQLAVLDSQKLTLQNELSQTRDFAAELDNITNATAALDVEDAELAKQCSAIESDKTTLEVASSALNTRIAILEDQIRHSTLEIIQSEDGICEKCNQPINGELVRQYNVDKRATIEVLQAELSEKTAHKTEHITKWTSLQTEYSTIANRRSAIMVSLARNQAAKTQITFEQTADSKNKATYQQQLDMVTESISLHTGELNHINAELTGLSEVLQNTSDIMVQIGIIKHSLAEANLKVDVITKELGKFELLEAQTAEMVAIFEDKIQALENLRTDERYMSVAVSAFQEIPRQIFEKSIKNVENLSNEYIHEIYPHVSVHFYEDPDKKNKPLVISCLVDNNYRSYKRLSGGQRTVVNIGLRLGFSKILMQRAKSRLQFLVLDEPFGALDVQNRSLIKKVLTLLSDQFKQIFIVTHTEDESDFQNVIKVKMNNDFCSYV